jgi:histidinol-phosphate aminotransferase
MDINRLMNSGLRDIKPYVGGRHKDEAREKYRVENPIKLSSNENPLGVSPKAVDAALTVLPESNVYPDGSNTSLREAIASKHGLSTENVIVGNGADEIIYYIAMSLLNDGDGVVIPRLTFPIYEIACRAMRARIMYSEMKGLKIDIADVVRRVDRGTKLVALCNPNNPTGHALHRDEVYPFIEAIPKDVIILMDEAYMEFADRETFPDTVGKFREGRTNIIVVKTLSKAYGLAGFRVGYALGDEGIIELMNRIKLPFNISLVSQYAALAALHDEAFLRKTVENTARGREMIYGAVKHLGLSCVESGTNFVLIDTGKDGDQVAEELMKRGVIVRSAKNYGISSSIRVTIGTPEQNDKFMNAMEDIFRGGK